MKTSHILILVLIAIVSGCSFDDTKQKLNKVGNATGQAVGELASGVAKGVESSLEPKIELSASIKEKGIEFGKITVQNDSAGNDNLLIVYMIFSKDVNTVLLAKVLDNAGLEMGRVKLKVLAKKDDAKFVEFHFDKRTNIDNDSKIVIE